MHQRGFTDLVKSCLKADLAIYSFLVDVFGQCMHVLLILETSILVLIRTVFVNPVTCTYAKAIQ